MASPVCIESITDDELNRLADRFQLRRIQMYCGCTFEAYLMDPDHYERQARLAIRNNVKRHESGLGVVDGGAL